MDFVKTLADNAPENIPLDCKLVPSFWNWPTMLRKKCDLPPFF